jgi:diaminohydroxyphosphoribosylaminopyrimidine deaminase / 5-amino-6-(5-phosphoribosylamino)uracil reductase
VTEQEALTHALSLAQRGWGRVAPNPLVGCVLLQGTLVVGEGWHAEFGGVHAERMALDAAGQQARGATAIVTLEPCAHQGKQPPCVDALIAAGVRRVVVAAADPNPEARGGAERLRAAGIDVEVLADERARRLNAPFFHRFSNADRPWVALKLATSREGMIAPADRHRMQLSGVEAQEWLHDLRAGFDAIAVGGATAIADDPALTPRGRILPRVLPTRVILAGATRIPPDLKLFADGGPRTLVLGGADLPQVSLEAALSRLRRAEGIHSLLVEGGGRLALALVLGGFVDRYYWIETPLELPAGIPAFPGYEQRRGAPPGQWLETERKSFGDDILHVMERA